MVQGLQDTAVPPWFTRDYFDRVVKAMGGRDVVDTFMRYYELSGVGHVLGGSGADSYSGLDLITAWVENGTAPYQITAKHVDDKGEVEFTRPHFPYPDLAFWDGVSDPKDAGSFIPKRSVKGFWKL